MTSVYGNFGNAASSRPAADAWCLFEIDGGNPPILLDSHGVGSVSRVQPGVFRVSFTNPERFVSGAYVGLVQDEYGNASTGWGHSILHGTTGNYEVTASGASASCDIAGIGFTDPIDISRPSFVVDLSNTFRKRVHAAFFCLRSDADINKMRVANYAANTENMSFIAPSGSSGGTILVPNAAIAPDGTNTAVGVRVTSNSLGVRKTIQANIGAATSGGVNGKPWNGSIYVKSGEASRVLKGASANVSLFDNGIVGGGGIVMLNTDTGATATASISSDFLGFKVENAGNGWWRISSSIKTKNTTVPGYRNLYLNFIANQTAGAGDELSWSGNGSIEFYVWGTQLEEGTSPTPYVRTTFSNPGTNAQNNFVLGNQDLLIDTHPGTNGLGVGSRQNLFNYSQTFTNAYWIKTRIGVSAGGYTAPDGTTTAMKLHELDPSDPASSPQAGTNYYYKSIRVAPLPAGPTSGNGNYTVSIFAKAAERRYITFTDTGYGGFGQVVVDLISGSVTQNTSSLAVKTIRQNDGWWRVVVSYRTPITLATSSNSFGFAPNPSSTVNSQYGPTDPGVSGSGILIWGAQLEQGTVFGDYTPTVASIAGTTYSRLAGNTYPSAITGTGNRGEATAWGTIVIPPYSGSSTPVVAYLENAYGVSSVSARSNSIFDVIFNKPMTSNAYCVITGTEQESVYLTESAVGLPDSIPPTDEYTLNILRNESTAESQKTKDRFTITCLRQVPPSPYISVDTTVGTTFAGDATYKILKEHTTTSTSSSIYLKWDSLITTGSYWYRLKVQRNRAGVTTDLQDAYYTSFYDYRVGHTQSVHSYHTMKYDVSGNQNGDKYIISGVASQSNGTAVAGGSSQTLQLTNFVAFNRNCNFTTQPVHYQRGRTQRIHFMVFGGKQIDGTP